MPEASTQTGVGVVTVKQAGEVLGFAGARLVRLSSGDLAHELGSADGSATGAEIARACHDRWTDLAAALTSLPRSVEAYLLMARMSAVRLGWPRMRTAFLVVGRDATEERAAQAAQAAFADLWRLLTATLDYAELEPLREQAELEELVHFLRPARAIEIRRRLAAVSVGRLGPGGAVLGFGAVGTDKAAASNPGVAKTSEAALEHLFPWVPSDDPWIRLFEVLRGEPSPVALVVHLRGLERAPQPCREEVLRSLAEVEGYLSGRDAAERPFDVLYKQLAALLRDEMLHRLTVLDGPVVAMRVFLTGEDRPSPALVATARRSLDDPSIDPSEPLGKLTFRGGSQVLEVDSPEEVTRSLDQPDLDLLFGPREAAAAFRTPMPTQLDLPDLGVGRSRTAPFGGESGEDCLLGYNSFRGRERPVALSDRARFRHVYLIGQTGTGKSTLMLQMVLQDLARGRGVAVLDPHGPLIEGVLAHLPEERIDDVVLLDISDSERPVGFNPLRILEEDPETYLRARDLVIDDLQAYLERTYSHEFMGPIFETHFRGMLRLLLGDRPQDELWVPNLMLLRPLYQRRELRRALASRLHSQDPSLEDFLMEVASTRGEASLENISQYVTSKFSRFIDDANLRNITCQRSTLDLATIIEEGKILLCYLGKGRIGDHPAGLLASQLVSRIRWEVMRRGAKRDARPFYLYVDEFHLFANQRFAELLAEARKFRLSITVAHQFAKQLPEAVLWAVLGNVGTMIAFRVGALDAKLLEPLVAPTFSGGDLSSVPNFRACVKPSHELGQSPFSLVALPPPADGRPEVAEQVRDHSRKRYGRPRKGVEKEILETYQAYRRLGAGADD